MASTNQRQSLKALQERLATRLAEAKKSGPDASWLAVQARGKRYLLPLVHSGEIFPVPVIQPVPHTQPWFLGVSAVRGALVSVVDMALLFSSQGGEPPPPLKMTQETKLVALNTALGLNAALLIDRLVGLRSAGMFVGAVPSAADAFPVFSQLLTDAQGVEWQELNLQALLDWPNFLSVAA
jgi:twitching motility protein PilI